MSESPLVCVVVLNYRNYADTIECVRSLERVTYGNVRVVLVDNGSDNESERVLRERLPGHTVLQAGRNGGYAAGNNVGIRRALEEGARYVVILNNDTLVEPEFLSELVDHAERDPDAGLLGPMILDPSGARDRNSARRSPPLREIFWNRGFGRRIRVHRGWRRYCYYEDRQPFTEPTIVEVLSGSCMMLRAELLERIGLLDERTFLFWEEFILRERVRRTRYHAVVVPESRVVHAGGKSIKTLGPRAARAYLRSLDYYLGRYREVPAPLRWLTLSGPALYFLPGVVRSVFRGRGTSRAGSADRKASGA